MGMVSICQLTHNKDPPKRLSIAHWNALGESYLLSHKSSSGGGGHEGVMAARRNKDKMVKHCLFMKGGFELACMRILHFLFCIVRANLR